MKFEDYKTFRTAVGGKLLELEIGKVCEQTNGQVWVRYGETVVNVTVVASKEPRPDIDFFPLSCNYEEKMYAVGRIPGGFLKREGRPSEQAILFLFSDVHTSYDSLSSVQSSNTFSMSCAVFRAPARSCSR